MSQVFANSERRQPTERTARWIELAGQVLACGRMFRDDLSRETGRWRLSEPEFSLLWICREAPPAGLSQNELAAALAVSAAHVSGLVEQLRRQGLLEGRRAEGDRRRQLWRLTSTGRDTLQAILADLADWAAPLIAQLGADNSDALEQLLAQLIITLRSRRGQSKPFRRPSGLPVKIENQ